MSEEGLLFHDIFKVEALNPDEHKYDKVSRIVARSEKSGMYMLLDANTEIYPINEDETFLMVLSPSLVLNTKDGPVSLHEKFEYIMHGRLYNIQNDDSSNTGDSKKDDSKTDGSKTDGSKTDGSKTDGSKTDGSKTDCSKTDGSKTDDSTTDDSKTDDSKTEASKTDPEEVEVYASFGGLQMMLRGHASHCLKLAVDQQLFLLIRKV